MNKPLYFTRWETKLMLIGMLPAFAPAGGLNLASNGQENAFFRKEKTLFQCSSHKDLSSTFKLHVVELLLMLILKLDNK
jgi:hypothetical protein